MISITPGITHTDCMVREMLLSVCHCWTRCHTHSSLVCRWKNTRCECTHSCFPRMAYRKYESKPCPPPLVFIYPQVFASLKRVGFIVFRKTIR